MNRGPHPLGIRLLVLALALVAQLATAQDAQDAYLDRYDLAIGNLERAVASLPTDAVLAREEIDRAFNALLTLSRDTTSGPLASALERVFERARTAIANGSQDDLAVQAAVLEGGFQRLVYDSALRAAVDGNVPLARARLVRLAEGLGVAEADRAALADPDGASAALRFDLESGVADVIADRIADARAQGADGGAYRALASAYGAFLLVQDSPRAAANLNQAFVEAATALVDGDDEALDARLVAVEADIRALGAAARERRTSVPAGATADVVSQPVELPILGESPAPADAADEAAPAEATSEGAATADEVLADAAAVEGELTLVDVEALRLQFAEELRRERLALLETDLAAAGLPAPLRATRAEALSDAGYARLGDLLDGFAAGASGVAAAAHRGDDEAIRLTLGATSTLYEVHLSPIVRSVAASVDLETADLLSHLRASVGIRVQDAVVLSGQVEAVRGVLSGVAVSPLQEGARQTTMVWSGLVRAVVLLVVGILALVPLFLLNLAFGGGNRNWQLIGVALFLLLVPALFEGLVALASLLVAYAGLDVLALLPALSVFGSAAAQTVWASLTLLAVIFAISGLYGICVQFGLLGRRPAAPASSRSTRTTRATSTQTIDWDDEV
jgi:hypothetical protein